MRTNWTAGLKDKDYVKEIRQSFLAALVMRKRLLDLLDKKMKGSWASSMNEEGFDTPNWAYKQAYARGYEQAMKEISSLLKD